MKSNILGKGWLPYFHKLVSWGVDEDLVKGVTNGIYYSY